MDYKDENTWLMIGDCLERMKEIPDKSVDAVICDPPYGTTTCKWDTVVDLELMWKELNRVCKEGKSIVLFGSQPFSSVLVCSNLKKFKYQWVWNKRFAANFALAKHQPLKIHEDILVFSSSSGRAEYIPQKTVRDVPIKLGKNVSKSGSVNLQQAKAEYNNKVYTDKNPESILFYDTRAEGQVKYHPTQKPVALMEYLIKTYTKEGEVVLDFTAGSMSTAIACINTNRKGIMIEKDEHYFKVGLGRVTQALLERGNDNI